MLYENGAIVKSNVEDEPDIEIELISMMMQEN